MPAVLRAAASDARAVRASSGSSVTGVGRPELHSVSPAGGKRSPDRRAVVSSAPARAMSARFTRSYPGIDGSTKIVAALELIELVDDRRPCRATSSVNCSFFHSSLRLSGR